MWNFLENPGQSKASKVFEVSSAFFVLVSVMGLSMGTIPELQVTTVWPAQNLTIVDQNGTSYVEYMPAQYVRQEHPAFIYIEYLCIAFFTIEYSLRLFASPRKLRFMLKPLNIVDLLAIVPFYIEQILWLAGFDEKKLRDLR